MGLGLVFFYRFISHYASTMGLLVFVISYFLYHSGHYASAGAMAIGRVICHDPHEYKQSNENMVFLVAGSGLVVLVLCRIGSRHCCLQACSVCPLLLCCLLLLLLL